MTDTMTTGDTGHEAAEMTPDANPLISANEVDAAPQDDKKGKPVHSPRKESARIPVTVKGQKYVSPAGRHSQQTHRRAEERAAAQGNTTEKEQHAQDREAFVTELNRRADQKTRQQSEQKSRSAQPKAPTEAS